MRRPIRLYKTHSVPSGCDVCGFRSIRPFYSAGDLPLVTSKHRIGKPPSNARMFPAQLFSCPRCTLIQLGIRVNPHLHYPPEYSYRSRATKALQDNFIEMRTEVLRLVNIQEDDLVLDIGSNDGNLLSFFKRDARILGITPEDAGKEARVSGIPTLLGFFDDRSAKAILKKAGKARIITATNVLGHADDVQGFCRNVKRLLDQDGIFIIEVLYALPLLKEAQFDRIYLEHLKYFTLRSLQVLLQKHDLEVFLAKPIPSMGGSLRVFAGHRGKHKKTPSVDRILDRERRFFSKSDPFRRFAETSTMREGRLLSFLGRIKGKGVRIYGIGAPSRAISLVNIVGIDDTILDCVLELPGSKKIGYYLPGTSIPIEDEGKLYKDQPEYALLLSTHLVGEIPAKIRKRGFKGRFIVPLPVPRILR